MGERDHGLAGPPGWPLSGESGLRAPEFDVPLAHGGVVALLMCADLSSQEGADRYLRNFSLTGRDARPPTLEQLRLAKAVLRGVDYAIRAGDGKEAWVLVRRAHEELLAVMARRRAVVATLADLRKYRSKDDELRARRAKRNRPQHLDGPGEGLEFRAGKALRELGILDARFISVPLAEVPLAELLALVRNDRLEATGIATKLSLSCGAFEDQRRTNETDAAASKRVKKLYEKALKEVPTS